MLSNIWSILKIYLFPTKTMLHTVPITMKFKLTWWGLTRYFSLYLREIWPGQLCILLSVCVQNFTCLCSFVIAIKFKTNCKVCVTIFFCFLLSANWCLQQKLHVNLISVTTQDFSFLDGLLMILVSSVESLNLLSERPYWRIFNVLRSCLQTLDCKQTWNVYVCLCYYRSWQ
jgi:hypothetical protein